MWKAQILFANCIIIYSLIGMTDAFYYLTRAKKNPVKICDSKKLIEFLAEIQVIDPESIIKQATLQELEPLCKKINTGLESTHSYLKHCELQFQKNLYLRLIKGVDLLHDKLCTKHGSFIKAFKKYHPCCNKTDYKNCTGPTDWVEDSVATKICSAYMEISQCYYKITTQNCGEEAGRTIQELFNAVVNSILTVNCNGFKGFEFAADNSGKQISSNFTFYLYLFYIFTLILRNIVQ